MDTEKILTELRGQRERIEHAIAALEALTSGAVGAPPALAAKAPPAPATPLARVITAEARRRMAEGSRRRWQIAKGGARPSGNLSAAGRQRIVAAAKKMWAERKKVGVVHVSLAARRRLSELARKRWAARKRQGFKRL
jgi:hypothetical protein